MFGRGDKTFDPYATIARQEAAAFLTRGAKVLGMDTTITADAGFADGEQVDTWARDSVNFVNQIEVMNGTGNNMFTPQGKYSREQSFATVCIGLCWRASSKRYFQIPPFGGGIIFN